jgi:hypothetical protein
MQQGAGGIVRFLSRPFVAIAFGAFILCAETCLHYQSIVSPTSWLDLPLHDWLAGGLLVHSGAIARGNESRGATYLAAAWGFMSSLLAGAFLAHWEGWSEQAPSDEWISGRAFFVILFVLLAMSFAALVATVRKRV